MRGGTVCVQSHAGCGVGQPGSARATERSYGIAERDLTPAYGWSLPKLRKTWNHIKGEVAPWWQANSKEAYNTGMDGLARALQNWSTSRSGERAGTAVGFPKSNTRHRTARSVRFRTGVIRRRALAVLQVIVASKTGPAHTGRPEHPVVGADVGVRDLLVVATPDGTEVGRVGAPKPLTRAQSRLRAAQRQAARRRGPYDPQTKTHRSPRTVASAPTPGSGAFMRRWPRSGRMRSTRPPVRWPPATRLSRSSSSRPRTWPGPAGGVNVVSTGSSGMPRTGGYVLSSTTRAPGVPPIDRDLNAAINLARLGDPTTGGTGTGTDSRSAANHRVGDGRGAIQKTSPTTTSGAVGTAGGDEPSTPHTTHPGAGTAAPRGEAA